MLANSLEMCEHNALENEVQSQKKRLENIGCIQVKKDLPPLLDTGLCLLTRHHNNYCFIVSKTFFSTLGEKGL